MTTDEQIVKKAMKECNFYEDVDKCDSMCDVEHLFIGVALRAIQLREAQT